MKRVRKGTTIPNFGNTETYLPTLSFNATTRSAGGSLNDSLEYVDAKLSDGLIDIGVRIRILALTIAQLRRKQKRDEEGEAISGELFKIADEIAEICRAMDPEVEPPCDGTRRDALIH